ncbi:MAG TPA: class I SAM-dependent methyltransferase [Acidobacteriota bacterium]|nr:class I SAM-dependent methyltransferase [Acidobacteriota bacterium]
MTEAEIIKLREKEAYDSIAANYDTYLARYNARFASDMVDMLYPQQGEVALDVAGGSGAAGLKLAERVGGAGSVVITDLSSEMLRLARKNAATRKLYNIRTLVMDAEILGFPDDSFDIVTCSFGVMLFPNVSRATSEMRRVLKPGGRIAFSVWSVPERFPLYAEPMTAFMKHASPLPVRALLKIPLIRGKMLRWMHLAKGPSGFSPIRFCEKGSLERQLRATGFQTVRRVCSAYPLEFQSFDEYWTAMMAVSPCVNSARRIPAQTVDAVRKELRARLVSPRTGGVRLFNEAAIILARKPISATPHSPKPSHSPSR